MPAAESAPRIGLVCSTMDEVDGHGVRRMNVPAPYVERVVEAGGLPVLVPIVDPALAEAYVRGVDGLVLVGGDDVDPALYGRERHPALGPVDRARDEFEIAALECAVRLDVPTFGICRGLQVANVAFGGTLVQDLPSERPDALAHRDRSYEPSHDVEVVRGSVLARALGAARTRVNSHHHQAIDALAPGLAVTARSPDGVVEAFERTDLSFFVCVQWHPERMPSDPGTAALFATLSRAASARRDATARRSTGAGV